MSILPVLYPDPQTAKERKCPRCGSCTYPPGFHCPRCQRDAP